MLYPIDILIYICITEVLLLIMIILIGNGIKWVYNDRKRDIYVLNIMFFIIVYLFFLIDGSFLWSLLLIGCIITGNLYRLIKIYKRR